MKLNNTQQAIVKEFESELKDKEIERRYSDFMRTKEHWDKNYPPAVNEYNSLVDKKNKVEKLVIGLMKTGEAIPPETIKTLTQLDVEISQHYERIVNMKQLKEENEKLIKKYDDYAERDFFLYWKILKAAGVHNEDWQTWYRQYKGKHI